MRGANECVRVQKSKRERRRKGPDQQRSALMAGNGEAVEGSKGWEGVEAGHGSGGERVYSR